MISGQQIEALMATADGFPRLQWDRLAPLVEALPERDRDAGWDRALHVWLATLAEAMSEDATVFIGNGLLLLASCVDDQGPELHAFAVKTMARLRRLLTGLPPVVATWTPVIIVFATDEQFYDYVNFFSHDDGEYGAVGGLFLGSGYPHVVVADFLGEGPWAPRSQTPSDPE